MKVCFQWIEAKTSLKVTFLEWRVRHKTQVLSSPDPTLNLSSWFSCLMVMEHNWDPTLLKPLKFYPPQFAWQNVFQANGKNSSELNARTIPLSTSDIASKPNKKARDQSNHTEGRVLALYITDPGLISNITYGSLNPFGCDPWVQAPVVNTMSKHLKVCLPRPQI